MTRVDDRRAALLERIADHLLREGLAGASLRPMAAAAGTSDRMLLYYFADKDELLAMTLDVIAARLARRLDETGEDEARRPFGILLRDVRAALASAELRPFMSLWLELAAAASRRSQPHRRVAGGIADLFVAWASDRLLVEGDADRTAQAALLLAMVDGAALLDAAGRGEFADMAVQCCRAVDARGASG